MREIILNCTEMEHPEPLVTVMEAIAKMHEDDIIVMIHRMVPHLLFPRLQELKLHYGHDEKILNNQKIVTIRIWRKS